MKKNLILVFSVLVLAACGTRYPEHSLILSSEDALVKTTYGTLCGYIEDGIYTFKGIDYAKAGRFEAPQDPDSWEGVQTAVFYGNQCHQAPRFLWGNDTEAFLYQWNDGVQSDNCQNLNVWTKGINDGKKRPVMVWLHGGGYAMGGSNELPFYEGTNLAKKDVVLVSINHRLNLLGYMDLSDFGEKYKYSGVAGVMDMVKALEWVNKNIEAFGGDPNNVTIFGQSGGGGKVNILLGTPSAKDYFQRGIIESGSMTSLMDKEEARSIGRAVVAKLGLTKETIDQIQKIPYADLLKACNEYFAEKNPDNPFLLAFGAVMSFSPEYDGEVIPYQLTDPKVAEISKGKPTIIGCNFAENNMLPAVFANADTRYNMGDTKQYLYIFNKPSTLMDGTFGTNHCTEMPFVFNNIWLGRFMVGCDKSAYKMADFMSDVWVSFAKNGVPDVKKFKWEVYNPETKPMVVFQDKTVTVHEGDPIFAEMAAYKAENWVFRQPYF